MVLEESNDSEQEAPEGLKTAPKAPGRLENGPGSVPGGLPKDPGAPRGASERL